MTLFNVGWPPPIVTLGGFSDSSDFDFPWIASSWIHPFFPHWGRGSQTDASTNPLLPHSQPPAKPDFSLMKPPHTELWPRKIKKPFHQNMRDGKKPVLILNLFHFCLTWPAGLAPGVMWMLATVNCPKSRDSALFIFGLCFACEAAPYWWTGRPCGSIHFKAAFPRVCPSDGDLHFVF